MSDAFKTLADKVQKLEDFIAKMQRTYEDLLYNLDGDNIGDGVIEAKHIKAGAISAETISVQYGDVAELTVDWLQTTKKIGKYLDSDVTDDYYIDAHEQHIRFIQASVIVIEGVPQTEGLSNRQGDTLYWEKDVSGATITGGYPYIDGNRVLITKTNTGFPVTVYQYSLLIKMRHEFTGADPVVPTMVLGVGVDPSGATDNGKGFIYKDTNGLKFKYVKVSGATSEIELGENGLLIPDYTLQSAQIYNDGMIITYQNGESTDFSFTVDGSGYITQITNNNTSDVTDFTWNDSAKP